LDPGRKSSEKKEATKTKVLDRRIRLKRGGGGHRKKKRASSAALISNSGMPLLRGQTKKLKKKLTEVKPVSSFSRKRTRG